MDKKTLIAVLGTVKKAWSIIYNGTNAYINGGSEASIDNLHDGAFTAEGWFYSDASNTDTQILVMKSNYSTSGWWIRTVNGNQLQGALFCATTNANVTFANTLRTDKKWHHVALTFDDAGDRKTRVWVDGVLVGTSDAGTGAVVPDAGDILWICGTQYVGWLQGRGGWVRISNVVRYTTTFVPQTRFIAPTVDANTVRLFKVNEGTGTTITDYSANAQNATLFNGTWKKV